MRLSAPGEYAAFSPPRSWAPFIRRSPSAPPDVEALISPEPVSPGPEWKEVTASFNDLGAARLLSDGAGYIVALSASPGAPERHLVLDRGFRSATMHIPPSDPSLTFLTDSMARILMSQAAVTMQGFMLHSSAVVAGDGGAYLFMGESGTGKSTHTRLWRETFADAWLLNDDLPIIRLMPDGTPRVFGTPWSGKTPCWRDESAPLRALVRLEQAAENEYTPLTDIEALVAILPGVSVITVCRPLYDAACQTMLSVIPQVAVGRLRCRPDHDAARISRESTSAATSSKSPSRSSANGHHP